jgi:autotransporter-associated beta strand protein
MPQNGTIGLDPIVPEGAERLLRTRQPYLTADQRRAVLATTEIESGYPLLDDSNGWGRINLVAASDGYGAFNGDVNVVMNADEGGFSVHDWWRNDISGEGRLSKGGTGMLTLTGDNSYSGGTLLEEGTLEAESDTAFGTGDVYVKDGTVLIDVEGTLALEGDFTMDDGTLEIVMDDDICKIQTAGGVYLDGGDLNLDVSALSITTPVEISLIVADAVYGEFDQAAAPGYFVTMAYGVDSVVARVAQIGDLDGNGIIDRGDVRTIRPYLRQPADAFPAADIDGDGVITVRDARKLATMCTCDRCSCI